MTLIFARKTMAAHNDLGKEGEEMACQWLADRGYIILEKNWKNRHEEIDLITRLDDQIVFIEVKTRSSLKYGNPEDAVSLKKQRNLVNAGHEYILKHQIDLEAQFDILSILIIDKKPRINHIERAFSPFD